MSRIALTGGTGFVGGTVASVLTERGHDVACLLRGDRGSEFPWRSRIVDTNDVSSLAEGIEGADAVLHLAIYNDFNGIYADAEHAYDAYVGLTRRVTAAANLHDARVGYLSTDWVFDGTGHLVDEEEPPKPVNLYGYLKAASEAVVLESAKAGFVARVGGVQGLHQTQQAAPRAQDVGFGYFVLSIVDALRVRRRFEVWEDPAINVVATPIVAAEVGALLGRAVDRRVDGVLHFAGGSAVSRRELALATCAVFGLDDALLDFAPPPDSARLPAPVPCDTSMSGERSMTLLGTKAFPVEDQIRALKLELEGGKPVPLS